MMRGRHKQVLVPYCTVVAEWLVAVPWRLLQRTSTEAAQELLS